MTLATNKSKYSATNVGCLFIVMLLLTGCAIAPWETSVDKTTVNEVSLEEAKVNITKKPDGIVARKNLILTTELLANKLYQEAEIARSYNRYDDAKLIFDKVLSFLPNDTKSLNNNKKIGGEIEQSKKLAIAQELIEYNAFEEAKEIVRQVQLENPENAEAKRIQKILDEKHPPSKYVVPTLKVNFDKPVNLELRDANIKVVFDALSRATGVNFVLDKDIKPETKATIYLKQASVEEAIEAVISSNALQKKMLSENTIFVYPNTQPKVKEYQDLTVRSFYFTNTTAKQVSALLKAMIKAKDIFVDDRLNMLVIRDTPEVIRVAEKLIAANDIADPEVMLEIEVLEISRSRLQELGIRYPDQLRVLGANDLLRLRDINSISSNEVGVSPNPALNFKKTIGDVNLLSNPRIRVKNNEKAKVQVGDKIPIITTTSTANVGVSENVTYVDVGLKLDIEPRITLDNYVNIKVGLEVSSLGERTTTTNGANVFTIGTRSANTVLRLKDGETQVLAGLISDEERKNSSRLPGIGDIPLLGRLFSNQEDRRNKTEIVLAITPRVISNIILPKGNLTEYWSGTENEISDKPKLTIQSSDDGLSEEERERINKLEAANEEMRLNMERVNALLPVPGRPQTSPAEQAVEATVQPESQQQPLEPNQQQDLPSNINSGDLPNTPN